MVPPTRSHDLEHRQSAHWNGESVVGCMGESGCFCRLEPSLPCESMLVLKYVELVCELHLLSCAMQVYGDAAAAELHGENGFRACVFRGLSLGVDMRACFRELVSPVPAR